ncbi:MAG: methyl-accepting chemotaxis protein [Acidobacteria bacterium]|nr:methyl-accepting chemotaxis protein [Acidobacteriota bacterium]
MWNNIKIKTRLLIGFGILLVLFIVAGCFSLHELKQIAFITSEIYEHPYSVSNNARDIQSHIITIQRAVRDAIISVNDIQFNDALIVMNENEQSIIEKINKIKERYLGEKDLLDHFYTEFNNWKTRRDITLNLAKEGKKTEATDYDKEKDVPYVNNLLNQVEKIIDFSEKNVQEFMNQAKNYQRNANLIVILITLGAIGISFFIAYTITMSITGPLQKAVEVANHLAKKDLSADIEKINATNEMAMMLRSMKEMLDSLRQQIRDIKSGVDVVADSTTQISSTTSQFTSNFNEIAAAINETVTSMKEVKQTSELSSEKAKYVSDNARNIVQVSRSGERAVSETTTVMNGIREQMAFIAESIVGLSERTQSIGEIITILDDISGNIQLLAINASIEAVKAGEQGKGFSVVASELKNMVMESKQYTSQVRSILTEIQKATGNSVMVTDKGNKTVDNGVKQVSKTGEVIQALGQSIQESAQASMQIEATVRQQLAGIEQVFSAMENINTAIFQSVEGARQLESAAQKLEKLGKKLKDMAQLYKLND